MKEKIRKYSKNKVKRLVNDLKETIYKKEHHFFGTVSFEYKNETYYAADLVTMLDSMIDSMEAIDEENRRNT